MKVWKSLLKTAIHSFPLKELGRLYPSLIVQEGDEPTQANYNKGEDSIVQLSDESAAVIDPWQSREQQVSLHTPHLHCSWWCQSHCTIPVRFEQHLESGKTTLILLNSAESNSDFQNRVPLTKLETSYGEAQSTHGVQYPPLMATKEGETSLSFTVPSMMTTLCMHEYYI